MIVKNESKIISRLFDSVLSIIDTYCICDTGSDDDTVEVIRNYFKAKGLTGMILHEPFQNFGYNRTVALKAAKGMADYLLFLDADMKLVIGESFRKEDLTDQAYQIEQGCGSDLLYSNLRLVRSSLEITCVGVTHEHYSHKAPCLPLPSLEIVDIGDGGCKEDKFTRDFRLLDTDFKRDPTNCRTCFYLANTCRNLGRYDRAVEYYKKRIEMGGWTEEVWNAKLQLGRCHMDQGNHEAAIFVWLEAFDYYPERAEPNL